MHKRRGIVPRNYRFPASINDYSIILGLLLFSQVVRLAPL